MSRHAPKVSVITPVYNGGRFLRKCVESVLRQTFDDFEYIIVDNCSTDDTHAIALEYAERDPRVRVHRADEFVGALANANRAVALASSESTYCKVLHADDWMLPECLARMVELGDSHPDVAIIGSYRLIDQQVFPDGIGAASGSLPGRDVARWSLLNGPYLFGTPSSVLMRFAAIRGRDRLYDESLPQAADADVCLWLCGEWNFGWVCQILTCTTNHGETETTRNARWGREYAEFYRLFRDYGRTFLSSDEFARRDQMWRRDYSRLLASRPARLRDPRFRELHFGTLRPSWTELTLGFCGYAARSGVSMIRTMARRARGLPRAAL